MNWKFDFSPETSAVACQLGPFLIIRFDEACQVITALQDLHMMGNALCRWQRWIDEVGVGREPLVGAKRGDLVSHYLSPIDPLVLASITANIICEHEHQAFTCSM